MKLRKMSYLLQKVVQSDSWQKTPAAFIAGEISDSQNQAIINYCRLTCSIVALCLNIKINQIAGSLSLFVSFSQK